MNRSKPRIGAYICKCGSNIAATVDTAAVAETIGVLPGVVIARDYSYMCSDPGQDLIKQDIQELELNRIVVSSCSPLMHEATFRHAIEEAGLNAFYFQMANIREQCSWVIKDKALATEKAIRMTTAAVERVRHHKPQQMRPIDIIPSVLVVGGGISGIEAALKIADAGNQVYLVERDSAIGGHMAQLYKTFPTLDCAA